MKFSDRFRYKYLQKSYGKKTRKKPQSVSIVRTLDEIEHYLDRIIRSK